MSKPMVCLPRALAAWGTPLFASELKAELERLDEAQLPLQQGLTRGSHVSGDHFEVMILSSVGEEDVIRVRVGIHYQSIIAGCSCADDPTPVDELCEYCQVEIAIDRVTANSDVRLLDD